VKRERDLVRDLREIDDMSWAPGNISMPDPSSMAERYRAVFARYGLDVGGTEPDAAADTVRTSRVSAALIAGLSEWFSADPKEPHLRPLLDRLAPDAEQVAIRAAIQAGDEGRVRALVKALDGSKVPAWFAASIGIHPMVPQEEGVRLMAAAWRTHPANYVLAYRSSHCLWGLRDRIEEMLAWAKVAVALRPDSPFAHNQLGIAWRAMQDWGEAEASARRAIELSRNYPKYAGAHVGLGNIMLNKGDLDGAEANYRAALAIDPGDGGIQFNMGLVHERRGDLAGAEEWFRKGVAMAPTNTNIRQGLDRVVQNRAKLVRLDEIAAGRAKPATPADTIEFAILATQPPRRRYGLAVRFYSEAFAADPALADPLKNPHRYWAACDAVRAATGQDKERPEVGVEERGRLTGLALKWLRADLAQRTLQAKDTKQWPQVRESLTDWKKEPVLASVRDPASLAAMPPADRKAWEALWRDVDALLASLNK
jgi:tetratricopeptide (TPR) repeat protein